LDELLVKVLCADVAFECGPGFLLDEGLLEKVQAFLWAV
jgi:hypothetical protein